MVYNNEKLKTHIDGLDLLLFDGLCLHKNCSQKTLTILIQGEEGTYKSLLAMQLLAGISRSMRALERKQKKQNNIEETKDIKLGKSIFYSSNKSEDSLHDLLIDLIIGQCEEKVIKESSADSSRWQKNEFCDAFFSLDHPSHPLNIKTDRLDKYLADGLLYYNTRTNSLNLKKRKSSDEDVIVYKRKYDTVGEYSTIKNIPDCFHKYIPEVEILTGEKELENILGNIPCLVIQGNAKDKKDKFPKALVTIHIASDKDSIEQDLNPDVIIHTRITTMRTQYEIRQLSITKCTLQAMALGWHQYKKRSLGILVFPDIYVLTHKRNFQSSFYRRTKKDILQQTFSQFIQKNQEEVIEDLYEQYVNKAEERELKALENIYEYSQKGDKIRKVFQNILFTGSVGKECGEEAQLTAIIGKANNYKRFLASGGTFHESIKGKGQTLKVLLDKDGYIILRRMICPALMGMNKEIINEERLKTCRKCYKNIHFMNVDIRCTTSDEFFYYLLKQLEVVYSGERKITRIVIDDLQRIDHSFSQIKGNRSFLPALKDICKDKNVNVCVLCDEDATMARQLSVLADNVLFVKRTGFNSSQIYISRYSGHNQPNLIYACHIADMDRLFKCENSKSGNDFGLDELLIKPIDDFGRLSEFF